ncbi:MAG: hypothetical protein QM689_04405 [Oscillospiraceae bacterium]
MAKTVTITLDDKALNKQIKDALKRNPKVTARKVATIGIDLASKSARRAPIESGDLRNNCSAQLNGRTIFANQSGVPTAVSATKATASVGYSLPYALRQHEELGYSHDRTDGYKRADGSTVNMVAGGESKFLEKPFEENKQKYIDMIAKIPDEVLK